jgi:ATP-dependent 26S proteasome regulatory subunit
MKMSSDIILWTVINNSLSKLNSGNIIFDMVLIFLLTTFINSGFQESIKKFLGYCTTKLFTKKNSITYVIDYSKNMSSSKRYKSIMNFITNNSKTDIKNKVRELKEHFETCWDKHDNCIEKESPYHVAQETFFEIDKDLYGKMYDEKKTETHTHRDQEISKYITNFEIYSHKKSLDEIQTWVEKRLIEYDKCISNKILYNQYFISVSWDTSENDIDIKSSIWKTNVNFDNTYFKNKDSALEKINFWLHNKELFKERGTPYNLGIFLYGEPGGGKTRFIKALANYTKRHLISLDFNDEFDFTKLNAIMNYEMIGEEFKIPADKKIIVFEDIDASNSILRKRQPIKKTYCSGNDEFEIDDNDLDTKGIEERGGYLKIKKKKKEGVKNNNNLSYFLNMMDGLNEPDGRIVIITTNHKEYLDPAILRPGRMDIHIKFEKLGKEEIYNMSKLFWKDEFTYNIDNIRDDIENVFSYAELANIFRSATTFDDIRNKIIK